MKYEQSFCKVIGDYACYGFCILDIAKEITGLQYNPLQKFEEAIDIGYISFNKENYYDPKNFDILKPAEFLGMLTGKKFEVRYETKDLLYQPKKGEYIVERWERNGYGHFARTRNGYNSLQDSKCVTLGKLTSLRIFKEVS